MRLRDIAPAKGKRVLVLGGSRSGKSVAIDMLLRCVIMLRPKVEVLLLDTKPRFRAEIEKVGPYVRSAEHNYTDWEKGPVVPGSYRMDIHADNPLKGYWKPNDPCRVVIAQTEEETERPLLLKIGTKWFNIQKRGADRLLVVDELLDFYHSNAVSIDPRNNVPLKVNRAGGERGFSGLYGAQRPKGLSLQLVEEMTLLLLFHLKYEDDMRYLYQMGLPRSVTQPDEDYVFKLVKFNPGGRAEYLGEFRLKLYDWYLRQLSET